MKAKEYYTKYKDRLINPDKEVSEQAASDLSLEFLDEITDLTTKRGKTDSALGGVLREINDKWNALCELFIKDYGASPLIRGGLIEFLEKQIPGVKSVMNPNRRPWE